MSSSNLIEQRPIHRRPVPLQFEQGLLPIQSAAIAGEAPVGANNPMARNDDCDGIMAVGQSHGAHGTGRTDLFGDFPVRPGFPVGNRQQSLPDPLLKLGAS